MDSISASSESDTSSSCSQNSSSSSDPQASAYSLVIDQESNEEASFETCGSDLNISEMQISGEEAVSISSGSTGASADANIVVPPATTATISVQAQPSSASGSEVDQLQELRDQLKNVVLERILESENDFGNISVYDEEDEDEEDYEDDEDDEQDEAEISVILPITQAANENSVASENATATEDAARKVCTHEIRQAFSELFLVNGIANDGGVVPQQASTTLAEIHGSTFSSSLTNISGPSSIGSSECETEARGSNKFEDMKSKTTSETNSYDRLKFLRDLQSVGRRSPLDVVITDNFTLSPENADSLLVNLNWIFGDIDEFFSMPKALMEKLEYTSMIKFTAGDYVLQTTGLKCRDRERILEYKPMEVVLQHCVYFIALMVNQKIPSAFQALQGINRSVSYAKLDHNGGRWKAVFQYMAKTLEIFFNFIACRTVFKNDGVIPSTDGWEMDQRLYLSLAGIMSSKYTQKPIQVDVKALFEAMNEANVVILEWGLHFLHDKTATATSKKSRKNEARLEAQILNTLMKQSNRCSNPFIWLAFTKRLAQQHLLVGEPNDEGLMLEYRNIINRYGDIVQVRLSVVDQLQGLSVNSQRKSLIRISLERAVEINSLHPEANYRLAAHYSSTKTAGVILSLKYLKASIAVDSSNFNAVLEYCKILMGKHFQVMTAAFGNLSATGLKSADIGRSLVAIDVPTIITGFTKGLGAKFWTPSQVSQLKLMVFYALILTGGEEEALGVLLNIYQDNRIISELKDVDNLSERYGWSSTKITLRQLICIFTETYQAIIEEEDEIMKPASKPSTSSVAREYDEKLKAMLTSVISFLKDECK